MAPSLHLSSRCEQFCTYT